MPSKILTEDPNRFFIVEKRRGHSKPIGIAICPTLAEATIVLLERQTEFPNERLQIVKSQPIDKSGAANA